MPSASDTAYPRLKNNPSSKDLHETYTPSEHELAFAVERTRRPAHRVGLLLLLKTFQRLGYFVGYGDIPTPIVRHVAAVAGCSDDIQESIEAYNVRRHTDLVLEFVGVTAYGPAARQAVVDTCFQAARTRDDLPDIINKIALQITQPEGVVEA